MIFSERILSVAFYGVTSDNATLLSTKKWTRLKIK